MQKPSYSVIGSRFRAARVRLKLKQTEVAEKAGITTSYYGHIERGAAKPSLECITAISDILGLPLQEVFSSTRHMAMAADDETLTDDEFLSFFAQLNNKVSQKIKSILVGVCRQIVSLEE